MRGGGALALGGLGAVALIAAGVGIGAVALNAPDSASVADQPGADAIPVVLTAYDGARDQTFSTVLGDATELEITDAGRVTRSACVAGGQLASGDSPFTIDDRAVYALATDIPLWRDLSLGASGEDVRALQSALDALGYPLAADGRFGSGTETAVKHFLGDRGVQKPAGVVTAASFLWLPQASVTVGACEVAVGDWFQGGALATTAGGIEALKAVEDASTAPAQATESRVVRYGELTATVGEDGLITDPAFLAAVAAGGEFVYSQTPEGGGRLSLTSVLAEPLQVATLPPGAIYDIVGPIGCVIGDGKPTPVTVVASALGQTSVTFDGAVPAQVTVVPDAGAGSCR